MSFIRSAFVMPPAIIQAEVRSIESLANQCANGYKATIALTGVWLANHEELRRRYKEKWSTWDECCEFVYGCTRQAVHKKLLNATESFCQPAVDSPTVNLPPAEHIKDPPVAKEIKPKEQDGTSKNNGKWQVGEEVTEKAQPKDSPKPPTDLSGAVIPQNLLGLFDRKDEVTQMEFYAAKLHAFFQSAQKSDDPLWKKLRMLATVQTFTNSAQSMQWAIRDCLPEVVCPGCGAGSKMANCQTCDGSGVICEVRWNRDWVKSNDKSKQAIVRGRNHA